MATIQQILFIINPVAGTKNKTLIPEQIAKHLNWHQFNYELEYSKKSGHAHQLAKEGIARGFKTIVAVGGDGTVNEVASALIHTEATLGILPHGSGNGLARSLGIPMNVAKALQRINANKTMVIDAGVANGNPFFCTAGIGFDALIGKMFATSTSRGLKTYIKGVLGNFIHYQALDYSIKADGIEQTEKAFLITLANAGQWGNNAYISPKADIQDAQLDLCIMKPFRFWSAPELAGRLFLKSMHRSKLVAIQRVNEVEIFNAQADCFHFDGEHRDLKGPLTVKVIPACLRVLV